jgi:general secretion pathway protein G
MNCAGCGNEVRQGDRFCSSCGFDLARGTAPRKKMPGCLLALLIAGGAGIVMIPIAGIIAAIAIPNLLNAIDRGKQKRTLIDLRTVGTAVEEYSIDHDVYPVAENIDELRRLLEPEYVGKLPIVDGWGLPFQVESRAEGYRLLSLGKDGLADGCGRGATTSFDSDICFVDGSYDQWPEGLQR